LKKLNSRKPVHRRDAEHAEVSQRQDSAFALRSRRLGGGSKPYFALPLVRRPRSLFIITLLTIFAISVSYVKPPLPVRATLPQPPPSATPPPSLTQQWAVAAQSAAKLSVRKSGWYRVTQPELVAAGFNPDIDPRSLQLFADGQEILIRVVSANQGQFGPGDYLEFYGLALDTLATDTHIYWLVVGPGFGQRIPVSHGQGAVTGAAQNFPFTVERKDRTVYFVSLINGETDNFFGPPISKSGAQAEVGLSRPLTSLGPVRQTLNVQHLDAAASVPASLEVAVQGITFQDHQVQVQLNGATVGALSFTSRDHPVQSFSVSPSLLTEGGNTVTLTAVGAGTDVSLSDYVRLTYPHLFRADNDALRFTLDGSQPVLVGGFSGPNIRLLDITDPNAVQEYLVPSQAQGTSYGITFQVSGPRTLLARTDQQFERVASIAMNQPSTWHQLDPGANLVIISHRNFLPSLQPLQASRQSQGWLVAVVDVEDLYDEFSYGAHSPQAIKDFLAWAKDHWSLPPRFVLLVGGASYDPRNYLGYGELDLVPAKLLDATFTQAPAEDWFVDFNDDDAPEMALGRLPVRTAAEAEMAISKIISFLPSNAGKLRGAVLISDQPDTFDFVEANNSLRRWLPTTMSVQTINRAEDTPDAVRSRIIESINQGPLVINYFGHGSVDVWTSDGLLRSVDAGALTNTGRLSFFAAMECLNGYYADPNFVCLASALLQTTSGGAIAVSASTGYTVPPSQWVLDQELYRQLFSGQTLGEAMMAAKAASQDPDVRRTWALFGDPTLRLVVPFSDVSPAHSFFKEITKLWARGITFGCASSSYCPETSVTREQMAIFLIRALGMPNPPAPAQPRFADVAMDRSGYAFIEELARRGITAGCGGGNYCPDAPVTREQMAILLMRALGVFNPPPPVRQRFNDVPPTMNGYAFIDALAARGITAGCGGGNYCPYAPVNRGQMAAFLVRAFGW